MLLRIFRAAVITALVVSTAAPSIAAPRGDERYSRGEPDSDSGPFAFFGSLFGGGLGSSAGPVQRQYVSFPGGHPPGSIVISTRERRLYYVVGGGQAIRYGIGVGRLGFQWSGVKRVSAKREWPGWTPPPQMRKRVRGLPSHMAGGPNNPLGARAMYLGSSLYRIHGSNEPQTIGQAVSSGCFRMTNEDVVDLYSRVQVGAKVTITR